MLLVFLPPLLYSSAFFFDLRALRADARVISLNAIGLVLATIGAVAWVALFLPAGYFFGNLAPVKKNFHIVIFAIIGISILPAVIEYLRERSKLQRAAG